MNLALPKDLPREREVENLWLLMEKGSKKIRWLRRNVVDKGTLQKNEDRGKSLSKGRRNESLSSKLLKKVSRHVDQGP